MVIFRDVGALCLAVDSRGANIHKLLHFYFAQSLKETLRTFQVQAEGMALFFGAGGMHHKV